MRTDVRNNEPWGTTLNTLFTHAHMRKHFSRTSEWRRKWERIQVFFLFMKDALFFCICYMNLTLPGIHSCEGGAQLHLVNYSSAGANFYTFGLDGAILCCATPIRVVLLPGLEPITVELSSTCRWFIGGNFHRTRLVLWIRTCSR